MNDPKAAAAYHPGDGHVTLEQVEAFFVREGIHTYSEVLEVLELTDLELEKTEKERDAAAAALTLSDKQHHECIDKLHALRKKIADAPHTEICAYIMRVDKRPCTCWKSTAPTAEQ